MVHLVSRVNPHFSIASCVKWKYSKCLTRIFIIRRNKCFCILNQRLKLCSSDLLWKWSLSKQLLACSQSLLIHLFFTRDLGAKGVSSFTACLSCTGNVICCTLVSSSSNSSTRGKIMWSSEPSITKLKASDDDNEEDEEDSSLRSV